MSCAEVVSVRGRLLGGMAIPAHPLALTSQRRLDERGQRALTRYYLAAGAGGVAVGVHTTQFAIHDPNVGLLAPVLELAARTVDDAVEQAVTDERPLLVAGAVGAVDQAVGEAELAASLGYDAVLLSPGSGDESALIERAAAVGEVLPVIGFYLQDAVGGQYLSPDYWRRLADLPCVVAIKVAAFDRYRTVDVLRAVAASDRATDIALYTGNDDAIVSDLLTSFPPVGDVGVKLRFVGGLLGQWAVWTRTAVDLLRRCQQPDDPLGLLGLGACYTDANGAVFDVRNRFDGCIAGVNWVLHRQGLLDSPTCLDDADQLSPGQAAEIDRVRAAYPWLLDDDFVEQRLETWRA